LLYCGANMKSIF